MDLTVRVEEITDEQAKQLVRQYNPRGVDLGTGVAEAQVDGLIEANREQGGPRFLLTWKGGKIPRGARVHDHEIDWAQHGIVYATTGRDIGSYDRLVESGGSDKREQIMIVYLYPSM